MLTLSRIVKARRERGFTLVELLVVIGIIAVLIAILLPALNKARQSAMRVSCLSNMRQCVLEMRMYAQDYGDRIPLGYISGGGKTSSNTLWSPYTWPAQDIYGRRGTYVLMGFLYGSGSYMKQPMIWYCPSEDALGLTFNNKVVNGDWWNNQNLWPPYLSANNRTRVAYWCRPVAYWSNPSETRPDYVPSRDLMSFAKLKNRAILGEGYDTQTKRHKGGINVVYADGSGYWVPYENYKRNLDLYTAGSGLSKDFYILSRPDDLQTDHSNLAWPESGVWVDYDNAR